MKTTLLLLTLASLVCFLYAYTERLVFYDDFNKFDLNTWKHTISLTGGGNWEFQQYVNNRSTSWVDNGVLYLKPMLTQDYLGTDITTNGLNINLWGLEKPDTCNSNFQYGCERTTGGGFIVNPISSARVRSEQFSFKYGRVEIKAKLPKGDWIWPAIFMMPAHNVYGTWPASGEIDIMESRGNLDYKAINPEGGVESFASTLHWGPFVGENGFPLTRYPYSLSSGTFNDDFHVFGLYWDDKRMYTYLDTPNNKVMDLDMTQTSFWKKANDNGYKWDIKKYFNPWKTAPSRAPFNQEFFIILCNAVGGLGGYFVDPTTCPSGNRNCPKPWKNTSPTAFAEFWSNKALWLPSWKGNDTALQIDYVKTWIFDEISSYSLGNARVEPPSAGFPLWIGIVAAVLGVLGFVFGLGAVSCVVFPKALEKAKSRKGPAAEVSGARSREMLDQEIAPHQQRGQTSSTVNISTSSEL